MDSWWSFFGVVIFQVGDVAFSVPNSLVVTLERVLGNETVGMISSVIKNIFVMLLLSSSDY